MATPKDTNKSPVRLTVLGRAASNVSVQDVRDAVRQLRHRPAFAMTIIIATVSSNFFDVLRVQAPSGRTFVAPTGSGASREVVIRAGFWR